MKTLITLLFITLFSFSIKAQIDTTIAYYDFNNLPAINLHGTDYWVNTLAGTSVNIQISAAYSHDNSNAAHFTQSGGGVNASANRPFNTIFPEFNYADSGVYYLYFDMKREYWGSEFGLAYDQNNDGYINQSGNSEKGLRFKTAQNGGSWLYLPNSTTLTNTTPVTSGWNRYEIRLEPWANSGHGFITLRYKPIGSSSWIVLFNNVSAGLDTSAIDAKNPANWDQVFFHFTGSDSGLDNLEFWKIAATPPPPNQSPTDIGLSADTISENMPVHRFIGKLSTVDTDIADTHQYSLVSGSGDSDNSSFSISNDSLFSTVSFNYEDTSMRYIRVRTTDQAMAFYEKAFVINILDVVEVFPGMLEPALADILIYPNPSSGKLFIDLKNFECSELHVFDAMGRKVDIVPTLNGSVLELKLDVEAGIYHFVLESSGGQRVTRTVVISD